MSTPPGIAFVTRASRDLGRNTALDLADPPHERGDAARNRALLLDAARRLIASRGTDTVTMDEIAAAAGVGKGTLFRRFDSRDQTNRPPEESPGAVSTSSGDRIRTCDLWVMS
jgi:AcrR family transcriptional regulator